MKILLAGCGDLGQRTAAQLGRVHECYGLRRQTEQLAANIQPIRADLTDVEQLHGVLQARYDVVVVTVTPATFSESAYRASYLAIAQAFRKVMRVTPELPRLLIWASSTSVYGDHDGRWVDETTPVHPDTFSGKILYEAEKAIAQLPCHSVIVRFSGIYGPGRARLIEQVRAGIGRPSEPKQWSNRIHSDDCAAVFCHLIDQHAQGIKLHDLYVASDSEPAAQHDVREWLARRLGVVLEEQPQVHGPSRRCRNERLSKSGFTFTYPTFRDGYETLLTPLLSSETAKIG